MFSAKIYQATIRTGVKESALFDAARNLTDGTACRLQPKVVTSFREGIELFDSGPHCQRLI